MPTKFVTRRREAMATEFWITVASSDIQYARQAISQAWLELDRVEALLSRYVTSSDVSRIGRARAGEAVTLAPETHGCLLAALQMEADTLGAFNIAYRHRPLSAASALVALSDPPPVARMASDRVAIDLGGIGKGFALDRIASLMQEWELPSFLLRASASTMLAGSPPPDSRGWLVQIGPPADRRQLYLCRSALSGSGTAVKGTHIFDPRSGRPATGFQMTWAGAPSATQADSLSTATMAMTGSEIRGYCREHPECLAYVVCADGEQLEDLRGG